MRARFALNHLSKHILLVPVGHEHSGLRNRMGVLNQAWNSEAHNAYGQKINERVVEGRNGNQDADHE